VTMAQLLEAAPGAAALVPSPVPYSEARVGSNGNGNGHAQVDSGLAKVLQPLKAFGWVAAAWGWRRLQVHWGWGAEDPLWCMSKVWEGAIACSSAGKQRRPAEQHSFTPTVPHGWLRTAHEMAPAPSHPLHMST
jgi:hypothetical protein